MQPTYKIILDKRRPKKDGLYPVKIRVTLNRIQKYYPIGIDLIESDFERIQNSSVRKELRVIKNKIIKWESKANNVLESLSPFSFEEFKLKLYEESSIVIPDLYALFDFKINLLQEKGKVSTRNIYNEAKNSFKNFKSKVSLVEITPGFLERYEANMLESGRSITTISMYIRCLRSIYNEAIDDGLVNRKHYPFGKKKFQPKAPKNIKKALTIQQIKSIIEYEVVEGTNQQLAKDMWLLSYYCNGMNIKDILNLKFRDLQGGSIHYERQKTASTNQSSKPIIVTLIPEAVEIVDRWKNKKTSLDDFVFDIYKHDMTAETKQQVKHQFIKTVNKYMKRIGAKIGYDKPLTTYAARHSYATILKRSGAPLGFISEALGHKSLQTTEAYLDSFEDETRRKYAEMLVPK
jgi:integrase/recombinase XerD